MTSKTEKLPPAGKLCTALLLLTALSSSASAQQPDQAALRALVPPPRETLLHTIALTVGMGYPAPIDYGFEWEGRRFPAEIAQVKRQLQHAAGATRGELYRQLGELYRQQQEPQEAHQAFEKAAGILAQALERKPTAAQKNLSGQSGRLRAEYALALEGAGRSAEAETQIQKALQQTPRVWQVWAAAGQIRAAKALTLRTTRDVQPPNPTLRKAAQEAWNTARTNFDTAVRLAPHLPQPYEQRGAFLTTLSFATQPSTASSVAGLPDYERAVQLRPHSPYALTWLAWMEYTDYGVHHFPNQSYDNFAVWKVLPPSHRQRLLRLRRQIAALTTSRDRTVRAQAYTGLAWLEYEFHDVPPTQAQQHLQQALQTQPDFPEADEYLMHTFAIEGEWDSLARFSAERAQRLSDVRHHLIAAYAYYKQDRLGPAQDQTAAALKLTPQDPASNLFRAFLFLRDPTPEQAAQAGPCLEAAAAGLTATPGLLADTGQAEKERTLLSGFFHAQQNRPEEARRLFTRVLAMDRDNTVARQALTLLSK